MKEQIYYDFQLSKDVSGKLEEIAQYLQTEVVAPEDEGLQMLSNAWKGSEANQFAEKYRRFVAEVRKTGDDINKEAEQIQRISRKMYLIEQEAEQKIIEKGN